jgi:hypothetical protein
MAGCIHRRQGYGGQGTQSAGEDQKLIYRRIKVSVIPGEDPESSMSGAECGKQRIGVSEYLCIGEKIESGTWNVEHGTPAECWRHCEEPKSFMRLMWQSRSSKDI